jgi:ABC-type uncharacterized transport system substrate-binding protein
MNVQAQGRPNCGGRIQKGDKPTDLPVQQVTRLEMALNLKSAKVLGLTIPIPLLGRADKVDQDLGQAAPSP